MKLIRSAKVLTQTILQLRKKRKSIGFVPTMGYLHDGHLSLVKRAQDENDIVIVSVFVNPTQFGPKEDFLRYPRDLKRDINLLKPAKVDFLFAPPVEDIYPSKINYISPGPLARGLCGQKRPGHFRGVVTVVKRLFDIVKPTRAYFGEKDFQQGAVIQDMVQKLKIPVQIKMCELIREFDGVAMSSRNKYLNVSQRVRARSLFKTLLHAKRLIEGGEKSIQKIKNSSKHLLSSYVDSIDYVELVSPKNLKSPVRVNGPILMLLACFMGKTRLIDNMRLKE